MKASDILNASHYFSNFKAIKWAISSLKGKEGIIYPGEVTLNLNNHKIIVDIHNFNKFLEEELKLCNKNLKIMGVTDIG